MQIISGTKDIHLQDKSAVAIGKFDGIHLGHKVLMDDIISCKSKGMKPVIFTFDPPANEYFSNIKSKCLTTMAEKRRIFEKLGVEILVEYPLDEETAGTSPENFIREILVNKLNAGHVAAGHDVSYGYRGSGDSKLLLELGKELGYEVALFDKLHNNEDVISSSLIRELVSEGNMGRAAQLIGDYYSISGDVTHGNHIGTSMGFPTVNVIPDESKLLPPNGVYSSILSCEGIHYKAITNIGCKPTVNNDGSINVETFIFDFDRDIYGKHISVKLIEFTRPERRFESIEELKKQVHKDLARRQAEQIW